MEKLAIIDMGSNSIRFIVMQILDNNAYSFLYQQKESIRLGEGLSTSDQLSEAGMARAMTCLKVYRHMIAVMGVHTCFAVATAAVRVAKNGPEFIDEIKKETGISIDVIPGEKEAYYGYLGVINTIDMANFILFDLGGASVEISLIEDRKQKHCISIPIGAVTLTEKFKLQDTVSPAMTEKCSQFIRKQLNAIPWLKKSGLPVIGIGGTVRNIAKIDQKAINYPLPRMHNYRLPIDRFNDIFRKVSEKSYSARKKISGLSSDRADIIIAGTLVIKCLLEHARGTELIVSGSGLREGLFYNYYCANYNANNLIINNILTYSTDNFLNTLGNIDQEHIQQVMKITSILFDKLQKLHHYSDREKQLLLTAAKLHDVGKIINYYNHARHSAFVIGHAQLYGLTQLEQIITGFIAGYHHGISNKTFHAYRYSAMVPANDWIMIRKLSTLLALAEASDVTYEHMVDDIEVTIKKELVILIMNTQPGSNTGAPDYEMKSLLKQFEKEFGKELMIIWK